MANKRDTSQQKRAKQNRNQRAALQARTEGGPPKRPSRVAPATAEKLASKKEATEPGSTKTAAKGSASAKPRRERPPRPGDRPVDIETLEGNWYSKVQRVPGGSQVIMAAVMSVVCSGMLLFIKQFASDAELEKADRIKKYKPKFDSTILDKFGTGKGLLILAIPALAVVAALVFALRPQRRRVWLLSTIVVAICTVVLGLTLYMVVAGFLGYAVYKASKVEGPQPLLRRRSPAAADDTLDVTGSEEDGDPA